MRSTASVPVVAAVTLVVTACGVDEPTRPVLPEPSRDVTAAPPSTGASEGSIIEKDGTLYGFVNFDAERGLVSVHGWIVQYCEGNPLTPVPRTIITTPSQVAQRAVFIGQKEQPVVIYRSDTGNVTCALILSPDVRVGSGMVHHDQVFTLASFKATWRGDVMAPDGSTHHYTEVYQLTGDLHDPNNPDLWSLNTAQILVH